MKDDEEDDDDDDDEEDALSPLSFRCGDSCLSCGSLQGGEVIGEYQQVLPVLVSDSFLGTSIR